MQVHRLLQFRVERIVLGVEDRRSEMLNFASVTREGGCQISLYLQQLTGWFGMTRREGYRRSRGPAAT